MSVRTRKVITISIIVLLSIAMGFGVNVRFCGVVWGSYDENFITINVLTSIATFAVTFAILFGLIWLLNKYHNKISSFLSNISERRLSKTKVFIILFVGLVVCWLPYLLSFAPASVLYDSYNSILQGLNGDYSNQQPIVYTLLIIPFVQIGYLCGNINVGLFVYSCFQYLLLAFTCTSIITWLYTHKVKTAIVIIVALFYGLFPVFPAYSITMWKDPIFSIGLVLLSFESLNKKSTWYSLLFSILIVLFFRSNGIVVVVILGIAMIFNKPRRMAGIICLASVVFSLLVTSALLNRFCATRCNEDIIGIPLQQLAYTTVYDYDELTDEEIGVIDYIIPVNTIREAYTPCLVDSIKWNEKLNKGLVRDNTLAVLDFWIRLMPKHLMSYIRAYVLETYGFWMPSVQSDYGYLDLYITDNDIGIENKDLFNELFGISIRDRLKDFKPFVGSGTLLWVTLIGFVLCVLNDEKKCWFYLPGLLCWLSVMVSTPVAFSLRYVYVFALLVPVYIVLPFINIESDDAGEKG